MSKIEDLEGNSIIIFPEELKVIRKIKELKLMKVNNLNLFGINLEKTIIVLLDSITELGLEESKKELFLNFHIPQESKSEIKNGIKLGLRRYYSKNNRKMGGRVSRISYITKEIRKMGYSIFTKKGIDRCQCLENSFPKSTIYESLRLI